MKCFPMLLALWALAASARGQIVFSEVMFNPRGSEQANEFVELYNLSTRDTISLAGWKIGEPGALDEIIGHSEGLLLPPQQFALILDPTYFQASSQYDSLIPRAAIVMTIDDQTLGNGGLSNSSAETLVLLNAAGDTIAHYTYSLGNGDGISDEKIVLSDDDTAQNWADALRVDGTPGFANSVGQAQIDGELVAQSLTIAPYPLREDTPASLSVLLRNAGRDPITNITISYKLLPAARESGAPVYLGNSAALLALASNDTLRLHFIASAMPAGRYHLVATLAIAGDVHTHNDTISLSIAVGWRNEVIVINEIMFEPASGQPEWIEIYNPQNFSVPLTDWVIEDESRSRGTIAQAIVVPPRCYRALTASRDLASLFHLSDTSVILLNRFPALNNSGDAVVIRDFSGMMIDSVTYEKDWGRPGKSIEKLWHERSNQKRNWRPSKAPASATPAAFNSVSPRAYDLELNHLNFIPELPQFGSAVRLQATVRNSGRNGLSNFVVTIYYDTSSAKNWDTASLLTRIVGTQELAPEDSVSVAFVWPAPLSGKIYLKAEVNNEMDQVAENNCTFALLAVGFARQTLVMNEVMFDPPAGQPEWVEIFNPQSFSVSLCNWILEDEARNRATITEQIIIPPRSFRVLAPSRDLNLYYDHVADSLVIVVQNFPALNQTEETIRLHDLSGAVIDSLTYESAWGVRGKSIEKIWFERGNEPTNWSPSRASRGATPGVFNSVSPREYDLEVRTVHLVPPRPRFEAAVRLEAVVVNRGRRAASGFSTRFTCGSSTTHDDAFLGEVRVDQGLQPEDSLLAVLEWLQPPPGRRTITVELKDPLDLVDENNSAAAILWTGYPAQSVVINEIYASPRSEEIEWFELFNRSSYTVDLSEWQWRDGDANALAEFPDTVAAFAPGKYAVISPQGNIAFLDESALHLQTRKWLTLNNDGDRLSLYDCAGGRQDSVSFAATWGGDHGISLERINPGLASLDSANWSTCVDPIGATPGRENSIFTSVIPQNASISISPNPFSPNGDGHDDFAIIQANVPVVTATVHLKIYDLRGRLVRQLLNNRSVGSHFEVAWNGCDDQGYPARTGVYIIFLQAIHPEQGTLVSAKITLVLARIFE